MTARLALLTLTLTLTQASAQEKPAVDWIPAYSGNFSRGRSQPIRRVVIHTVEGSLGSAVGTFQNQRAGRRKVSAHYVVGRDGRVVQMVRDEDTAWHIRNLNADTIGIEHEGYADRNTWTRAQYAASARLTAWLCQTYGIPIDRQHIAGHGELPGQTHRHDPGRYFDWDLYLTLVREARAVPAPATTTASAPLTPISPASGQVLGAGRVHPALELRWQPAANQVGYRVEVEDVDAGKTWDSGHVRGAASQHRAQLSFRHQGRYRWRVHSWDGARPSESRWTPFSVDLTGPAVTIVSPALEGTVYDERVRVVWTHADPDAPQAGYRVIVRDLETKAVVFDSRELNGTATAYTLPVALPRDKRCLLSVQLHDGRGNVTQRTTWFYNHGPNQTPSALNASQAPTRGFVQALPGGR